MLAWAQMPVQIFPRPVRSKRRDFARWVHQISHFYQADKVRLVLKPGEMTRHRRLKTNGLIRSSQMLWGGDKQPFFVGLISGCFLPKRWYKQMGKLVVCHRKQVLTGHIITCHTQKRIAPVLTCGPENGLQLGMVYITQMSVLSALTRGIHLRIWLFAGDNESR